MKKTTPLKVIREIFLWAAGFYLAYMFLIQGWKKFDPEGFWAPAFNRWGYSTLFMYLIGFLEVAGAILLIIPKTSFYGGITLATVMAGALVTRSIHGASTDDLVWISIFMITSGLIAWLRTGIRWKPGSAVLNK